MLVSERLKYSSREAPAASKPPAGGSHGNSRPEPGHRESAACQARLPKGTNLAAGKARLTAQLKEEGSQGLFASIAIRLTMGEKADLGPDLDASLAPDDEQMDKAITRNCSFIDSAVQRSQEKAGAV